MKKQSVRMASFHPKYIQTHYYFWWYCWGL